MQPMIGYYIHHHGLGHLSRATSICAQLPRPVTALTSINVPDPHPFAAVLQLPRDDEGTRVTNPTAYGAFHWAPHHDTGLTDRMRLIAEWVAETRPAAVVVDVSVEVATFVRLLGVPVIVVAQLGERTDMPHLLVHRLADHIVAAWPRELHEPSWLRSYGDKISYVGGISRFDGREPVQRENGSKPTVLVLVGAGGSDVTVDHAGCMRGSTSRFRMDVGWCSRGPMDARSVAGDLHRRRGGHPCRTEQHRRSGGR